MSESNIISALQKAVTAAVAASSKPSLPVSYIDTEFTQPADGKWLEIIWIPNNRGGDYWGGEKNHRGILRLILHWPNNDSGVYKPVELLESIGAYFTKGLNLSGVQIYEKPDFTGRIADGDELLYPVSIRYQSFRS